MTWSARNATSARSNPRGGDRRGQRPLGAAPGASLWYGLGVAAAARRSRRRSSSTPAGADDPVQRVQGARPQTDQVAEVTLVGDQRIRGTLKAAAERESRKPFTPTRVEDSEADRGARGAQASSTPARSSTAGCPTSSAGSSRSLHRRALGLLLPPHGRRRRRRHVVRPQPREDLRRRRREGAASPTSPASTRPRTS